MIKTLKKLSALPKNPDIPILQYSPGGPFAMREGNFVEMEEGGGDRWIGNFQTKGGPDPVLMESGTAFVFGGRHLYVFNSDKAPKTFQARTANAPWVFRFLFSVEGESFLGVGADNGTIFVFDGRGEVRGSAEGRDGIAGAVHQCDEKKGIWTVSFKKGGAEKTKTLQWILPDLDPA